VNLDGFYPGGFRGFDVPAPVADKPRFFPVHMKLFYRQVEHIGGGLAANAAFDTFVMRAIVNLVNRNAVFGKFGTHVIVYFPDILMRIDTFGYPSLIGHDKKQVAGLFQPFQTFHHPWIEYDVLRLVDIIMTFVTVERAVPV